MNISKLIVVLTLLCLDLSVTAAYPDGVIEFNDYEVVQPEFKFVRSRKSRYLEQESTSDEVFSLLLNVFGRNLDVTLEQRVTMFSEGYSEIYQKNGNLVYRKPSDIDINCHYQGKVKGSEFGWAAVSTCNGLSGVIVVEDDVIHLQQHDNSTQTVAFRQSQVKRRNISCGSSEAKFEDTLRHMRLARSADWHFHGNPKSNRFVELFIIADRDMFYRYGRKKILFGRIREIVNIVNGIFSHFDIFVVLVGVLVWNERNPIYVSKSSEETLNSFASYRFAELSANFPNDNAQLLSGIDFNGDVVGLAFRGALCSSRYSAGINQDYSSSPGLVAAVMAHEIGHNFNMKHDDMVCSCPAKRCIMAPSTTSLTAFTWSSCSQESLKNFLADGMDFCLTNVPKQLALPSCGNGIVELEEQCDCGLSGFCNNSCCNSTTCELASHASCASGNCCDLDTCQLKKISTECRSANNECDLPEHCNGNSEYCPSDVFVQDGVPCPINKGICYHGVCRSRELQCQKLWGPNSKPSDDCCYKLYAPRGNCNNGLNRNRYQPCEVNLTLCDRLQCSPTDNKALICNFGENAKPLIYNNPCKGQRELSNCFAASVDFGLTTPDPGFVEDGTECGYNKVCFKKNCISLQDLKTPDCSKDCSNNGVCNNKGQCHCIKGFYEPLCMGAGPGGSAHSGPLMDISGQYNFAVVMYMIFFGIVPTIVISATVIYWYCIMGKEHITECTEEDHELEIPPAELSKPGFSREGSLRAISNKIQDQVQYIMNRAPMPYGRFDEEPRY